MNIIPVENKYTSDLNEPKTTIELGTKTAAAKMVSIEFLNIL
jgi:hypothetical protein